MAHVNEAGSHTFLTSTKSWFVGDNIPGKAHAVLLYANTALAYRAAGGDCGEGLRGVRAAVAIKQPEHNRGRPSSMAALFFVS